MKRTKAETKRYAKRVPKPKPNDEKFRELLLFIAERSENDPHFGAIKLNKLLFYCDFLAYQKLGASITGQEYFALRQGPAPRYGTRIREQMKADDEIAIQKKENQTRVIALRESNPKVFLPEEIALITKVLEEYRASTGSELSEKSHKFAGWKLAKEKEPIPYAVALVGNRLPTHDEIQRGIRLQPVAEACLAEHAARGV